MNRNKRNLPRLMLLLASLDLGLVLTARFGLTGRSGASHSDRGNNISGLPGGAALSAANDLRNDFASAAESVIPSVVTPSTEWREKMGFRTSDIGSPLPGIYDLPDERKGVVTVEIASSNVATLVGLTKKGDIFLKLEAQPLIRSKSLMRCALTWNAVTTPRFTQHGENDVFL